MLDPITSTDLVRREWSRVVATSMRILGDLGQAEDMAQEALYEAARRWPVDGIPANPGAWLTAVARNRALNELRSRRRRGGLPLSFDESMAGDVMANDLEADVDGYRDNRLRLVVMCCHPSLGRDAQVALTLRLVSGLSTREIARAYLLAEATVAQRISRAKARLREAGARFVVPSPGELPGRLSAVLEVIYLVFNEGYGPHNAPQQREILCREAAMLAEQLTEIAPESPDVWAVTSLIHFHSSRFDARVDPSGGIVPLDEQDRSKWRRGEISRGEAALATAHSAAAAQRVTGTYLLQAEIAARHARATTWNETAWGEIEQLYAALNELTANPVVKLNWAIATSYTTDPETALAVVDELEPAMRDYELLAATRADFLRRAGRGAEASEIYRELAVSAGTDAERSHYQRRLTECESS